MRKKTGKFLSIIFRIAFSIGLLAFLYHRIDIEQTKEVLLASKGEFILFAFGIYILIFGVILLRWLTFIRAMNLEVPLIQIVRFHFFGLFFNPILPTGIGGDLVKLIGLCAYTEEKSKVVGSVLLDRLVGFIAMIFVAAMAFAGGFHLIRDFSLVSSIAALTFFSAIIVGVLFHEKTYTFCCQIFSPFPKIKEKVIEMHYDIALLKDRMHAMYLTFAYSCVAQITLAVVYYLLARALHQEVSVIYCLIFSPLICVATALPSIGGLGVREASTAFLFAKAGMTLGISVSISLIIYFFSVMVGIAGAIFFVLTRFSKEDKAIAIKDGLKTELLD